MIDRRTLLATTMVGVLAPTVVSGRTDASPMADPLRAFMRMHSTLGGSAVWTMEGLIQGAMPGETARPLVGFHSIVEVRVTEPQPGVFRTEQREATWYTDRTTGAFLDSFTNPYTSEINVPFGYVSPTNVYFFDKTGTYQRELPPVRTGELHHDWGGGATTLWVSEGRQNIFPAGIDEAEFPRAFAGNSRVSVDILTYQARRADFDRRSSWVPVTLHMTTNGPWPYWLMMGRRAGTVIWTGHGEKYRSIGVVPQRLRDTCERIYPGFLADPLQVKYEETAPYHYANCSIGRERIPRRECKYIGQNLPPGCRRNCGRPGDPRPRGGVTRAPPVGRAAARNRRHAQRAHGIHSDVRDRRLQQPPRYSWTLCHADRPEHRTPKRSFRAA
jgi:hypothetical protein